MIARRLKHMLLRLSAEEKVIGIGGLAVILGVFMPWYSVVLSFEKGVTESGFSGDLGVVGFVCFLLTLISLGFLMGDHLHFRLPSFGFKKENVILFFNAESAFLLLLVAAIFTKRSLDYTNAEIRFGLYMALVGSLFAAFAAFAQIQRSLKKETKAFFEHDEAAEEPAAAEPSHEEPVPEESVAAKPHSAKRHHVVVEGGKPVIQERFFEEEEAYQAPSPSEDALQAAEEVFEPAQSETTVEEVVVEEIVAREESKPSASQGNFFLRDAEIAPPEASEKKDPEPARPSVGGTGFYNDL